MKATKGGNVKYQVTFWRSDAYLETEPQGDDEVTFTVSDGVQLTYNELRETENGEPLARFEDTGLWHVVGGYDYSDISIVAV